MRLMSKVLFIGDKSEASSVAVEIVKKCFDETTILIWEYDDYKPKWIEEWQGDWLFSFKSDLILSQEILRSARCGTVNIHPAPPTYRGIGGYHYAIQNREKKFGATAHRISEKIDFGSIIKVKYFEIQDFDTVDTLRIRTALYCVILFCEILDYIVKKIPLPTSKENWSKKLYTRKELELKLKKQQL